MKLRIEKINHIAHLIANQLIEEPDVNCLRERNDIRLRIKDLIIGELKLEDEVDLKAKEILDSYSRQIPEGSREWEILYRKTFEEEMAKRRQDL